MPAQLLAALTILLCGMLFAAKQAAASPLPFSGTLLTGVASNSADYASWDKAFDGRLALRMVFQQWAFNPSPETVLDGPGIPIISWEPWSPPAPGLTAKQQGAPQPKYSNASIADGDWDAYITEWAQAIKAYGKPVILRPMHEFNGFWYPWSHNPKEYVLAWRHMWNIFHAVGADNVTWVWSFQVNAFEAQSAWAKQVKPYWPGAKYVDVLGMSMLRFAGGSPMSFYAGYLQLAHRLYKRPTMITEANVTYEIRLSWLSEMRRMLARTPFNEGLIWSQSPSQEQARNPTVGNMNWDARTDPGASSLLASIAQVHPAGR